MTKELSERAGLPSSDNSVVTSTAHLPQHSNNSIKVAFPIDGGGGVHEDITKAAASTVGIKYSKSLERGVEWPDVPSEKPGKINYPGLLDINKPGTITYESHNGANQFWHSMAPSDAQYTNGQVLNKIVNQAAAWYDVAKYNNSEFYLGHVLHMVQDSYSSAHVVRDENGAVVSFQAYDKQDHSKHKHGEAKEWVEVSRDPLGQVQMQQQSWQEVPGAMQAYRASVKIMEMYRDGANSEALKTFLREDVYQFRNEQVRDKPAGEVDPKYAPKEKTRIADATLESGEKYALMAKTYLEKSPEEAVAVYPDLVHVHAKKAALSTQLNDMPEADKAQMMRAFDSVAVKNIAQGKITPMQIAMTNATENSMPASNAPTFS